MSSASAAHSALRTALNAGAMVIDLRPADSNETIAGTFTLVRGALSAVWDRQTEKMPLGLLPEDKTSPLILYCRSGSRAEKAKAFLAENEYTNVFNGGGPKEPEGAFSVFEGRTSSYDFETVSLTQLLDGPAPTGSGSSTYTYILADAKTGEALIIDPVLEQVDRDMSVLKEKSLKLTQALNTHCHADHITGTGELKKRIPGLKSFISAAAGAKADVLLGGGDEIKWADGRTVLKVLSTPGHTNGCVSYFSPSLNGVFTGDALLIGGCGRTDFQEGSAETLYDSVHGRIFTLGDSCLVYPAHDYKGRSCSTVGTEKTTNARLTKSKAEFVEIMANLNLPYPKQIDRALPANLMCGC